MVCIDVAFLRPHGPPNPLFLYLLAPSFLARHSYYQRPGELHSPNEGSTVAERALTTTTTTTTPLLSKLSTAPVPVIPYIPAYDVR